MASNKTKALQNLLSHFTSKKTVPRMTAEEKKEAKEEMKVEPIVEIEIETVEEVKKPDFSHMMSMSRAGKAPKKKAGKSNKKRK